MCNIFPPLLGVLPNFWEPYLDLKKSRTHRANLTLTCLVWFVNGKPKPQFVPDFSHLGEGDKNKHKKIFNFLLWSLRWSIVQDLSTGKKPVRKKLKKIHHKLVLDALFVRHFLLNVLFRYSGTHQVFKKKHYPKISKTLGMILPEDFICDLLIETNGSLQQESGYGAHRFGIGCRWSRWRTHRRCWCRHCPHWSQSCTRGSSSTIPSQGRRCRRCLCPGCGSMDGTGEQPIVTALQNTYVLGNR